jgi:hypothetical protein
MIAFIIFVIIGILIATLGRFTVHIDCIHGEVLSCGIPNKHSVYNVTLVDKTGKKYFFRNLSAPKNIAYNTFGDFRVMPSGKFCITYAANNIWRSPRRAIFFAYKSDSGQSLAFDDDFRDAAVGCYFSEFFPRFFTGGFKMNPCSPLYIFSTLVFGVVFGAVTVFCADLVYKTNSWGMQRDILPSVVILAMCTFFIACHIHGFFRKRYYYKRYKQFASENGIDFGN